MQDEVSIVVSDRIFPRSPHPSNCANIYQEIQEATASEPLSIEEEYSMQKSWRQDADKLTFIVCRPIERPTPVQLEQSDDSPQAMIGDINLFLRVDDGDDGDEEPQIIGEIELMIAEKVNQRQGFGKAATLVFLRYILDRQQEILTEFIQRGVERDMREKVQKAITGDLTFTCLSVKIGNTNVRSLALFEGLGFQKVSQQPNFFGEFELRRTDLECSGIDKSLQLSGVERYSEVLYTRTQ